eukprot:tig00021428_g21156.t1
MAEASAPASGGAAYLYMKTLCRSGVVLHVAVGRFRPGETLVVFAKQNVLELLAFGEDGELQSLFEQPVFGTVRDIAVVPGSSVQAAGDDEAADLLAVVSDSGRLSFLAVGADRFRQAGHVALAKHGSLDRRELGRSLAVDPRGRCVAVAAFESLVYVYPLGRGPCPAEEGRRVLAFAGRGAAVWDAVFLEPAGPRTPSSPSSSSPRVRPPPPPLPRPPRGPRGGDAGQAGGCGAGERVFELRVVPLDLARGTAGAPLVHRPDHALPPEELQEGPHWWPHRIAPVPGRPACLLLFQEGAVSLFDAREGRVLAAAPLPPPSQAPHPACAEPAGLAVGVLVEAFAWEREAAAGPGRGGAGARLFATTEHGDLLEIRVRPAPRPRASRRGPPRARRGGALGRVGECAALASLGGGLLLCPCQHRDGAVVQVAGPGAGPGAGVEVRGEIPNLAPVLDFALVDFDGENQDQLFACCGMGEGGGSVRVVRNGIGALEDVTEASGLRDAESLAAGHTGHGEWLLQATREGVTLARPAPPSTPPRPPGDEPAGGAHVVLGWRPLAPPPPRARPAGGPGAAPRLLPVGAAELPHELSCLEVPAPEACRPHAPRPGAAPLRWWEGLCLVGTYRPSLLVLALAQPGPAPAPPTLLGAVPLEHASGPPSVPESARLVSTDRPALFVGLRDGSVLQFDWRPFDAAAAAAAGAAPRPSLRPGPGARERASRGPPRPLRPPLAHRLGPEAPRVTAPPASSGGRPASPPRWGLRGLERGVAAAGGAGATPPPGGAGLVRYSSVSFGAATHAAPFVAPELPRGVCFVADDGSLHLCSLQPARKLNARSFPVPAAFPPAHGPAPPGPPLPFYPTRLLFHGESRALAVLASPAPSPSLASRVLRAGVPPADVRLLDPLSGELLAAWPFAPGEVGTALARFCPSPAGPAFLAVGTGAPRPAPAPPPPESADGAQRWDGRPLVPEGRLLLFRIDAPRPAPRARPRPAPAPPPLTPAGRGGGGGGGGARRAGGGWRGRGGGRCGWRWWRSTGSRAPWPPSPLPDLVPGGDGVGAGAPRRPRGARGARRPRRGPRRPGEPEAAPGRGPRLALVAQAASRGFLSAAAAGAGRLVLADRQESVAFYSWRPGQRRIALLRGDARARSVMDVTAPDDETCLAVDAAGVAFLAKFDDDDVDAHCERNLRGECEVQTGELPTRLRLGSLAYRGAPPASPPRAPGPPAAMAGTMLGALLCFAGVAAADFALLDELQRRLAAHAETRPVLGHDHGAVRGRVRGGAPGTPSTATSSPPSPPRPPPSSGAPARPAPPRPPLTPRGSRELVAEWPEGAGPGPSPEALCRLLDALDQRLM